MSLMIIDKRNGDVVATGRDRAKVFAKANARGVAREDMMFVVGEPDIRVFRIASIIMKNIDWLPQFLFSHGKGRDVIERAEGWLQIWRDVIKSRFVDEPDKYPLTLAVLFGNQLADEINAVIDAFDHPDCIVKAPITIRSNNEADQEGYEIARSHRRHLFLLARHDVLGVYVVAPSTFITRYEGFTLEHAFARRPR